MRHRHSPTAVALPLLVLAACADPVAPPVRGTPAGEPPVALSLAPAPAALLAASPTSLYGSDYVEAFDVYAPEAPPGYTPWAKPPARWRPTDAGAALPTPAPGDTTYSPFYGDLRGALANWSIVKHDRDDWYDMRDTEVWHHPTTCAAPPETHVITAYDQSVYLCRNHMMTAVNARGYGVTYLTPNRMIDFSSGTATVRFDVATLRTTRNDWIDLWITPYEDNLVTPLDGTLASVDLQGEPRRGLHIRMTADARNVSAFRAFLIVEHVALPLPVATFAGYETRFAQSATVRRRFELQLTRTRLRFGMPNENIWWVDTPVIPWIPLGGVYRAVVQLGHHSMNPAGDGGTPTTWHWDNIAINPAVPFTIVNADRRYADAASPSVNLRSPAPPGGRLRFAAHGRDIQVSFDGGAWRTARRQSEEGSFSDRFRSYWMTVPAGTRTIRFRGTAASSRFPGWFVRDVSVWAGGTNSFGPDDEDDDD